MMLWLAHIFFIMAVRVRIPAMAVKFHSLHLVCFGSNRLFPYPLDVLNVLYCHQPVSCVCVCVCVCVCCLFVCLFVCVCRSPVLVVARPWQWKFP